MACWFKNLFSCWDHNVNVDGNPILVLISIKFAWPFRNGNGMDSVTPGYLNSILFRVMFLERTIKDQIYSAGSSPKKCFAYKCSSIYKTYTSTKRPCEWWISFHHPALLPIDKSVQAYCYSYSITTSIANIQTSCITELHQFKSLQLGLAMPCTQDRIILIPFVFR